MRKLIRVANDVWSRTRKPGAVRRWAERPEKRYRKRRRFEAAAKMAKRRRRQSLPGSKTRKRWAKRERSWAERARQLRPDPVSGDNEVIDRAAWGARSPLSKSSMTGTQNGVFIHHTVAGAPGLRRRQGECCSTDALVPTKPSPSAQAAIALRVVYGAALRPLVRAGLEAAERAEMRNLQAIAFSRGFADISYSFVVMPSGRVYEGRGLGVAGAHTIGYNSTAYGCSAAGNYDAAQPTDAMVAAFRWLRRDYLGLADAPLRGHRNVYSTACPGRFLYDRLGEL